MLLVDRNSSNYYNTVQWSFGNGVTMKNKFQALFSDYRDEISTHLNLLEKITIKVNNSFFCQLIISKGIISDILQKFESLKGLDFSDFITETNKQIKSTIEVYSNVEKIATSVIGDKIPSLPITLSFLSELIENLYSIIRLLKRLNRKKASTNYELAEAVSSYSFSTLNKVLGGKHN